MSVTHLPRSSGEVWAIPPECAEHQAHDRELIHCLKLARSVYVAWCNCKEHKFDMELRRAVDGAMQALLSYSIETYQSGVSIDEVVKVFAETERCSDYEFLKELSRGVIPLALVRVILYRDEVQFSINHVPCWDMFAKHYGPHIFGLYEHETRL